MRITNKMKNVYAWIRCETTMYDEKVDFFRWLYILIAVLIIGIFVTLLFMYSNMNLISGDVQAYLNITIQIFIIGIVVLVIPLIWRKKEPIQYI